MANGLLQKITGLLFIPIFLILALRGAALASSDEDMQTLGMYYDAKDLVVTATRNPRPISQSAENITVITAKDIEMMGAHTLVDIFANIPGIQSADQGGPGTLSEFSILGADSISQMLMMIDGVNLNVQANQFVDLKGIPIQNIERIEIVKGPGSSSWGSALGAVINIVTRSPFDDRKLGGRFNFLAGERGTRDTRGEISGTVGPFGYYVYAGNLTSRGFRPNTAVDQNDFYGKLLYQLPNRGSIQFSIAYDRDRVGNGDLSALPFGLFDKVEFQNFFSTLSINYPLTDSIDLDLSYRSKYTKSEDKARFVIDNPDLGFSAGDTINTLAREWTHGGSAKVTWRSRINTLAAGVDYDFVDTYAQTNIASLGFADTVSLASDKYGVFLNDTLVMGDFALTPGIRYDRMKPVGDFYSPSFGVAWNPSDKITLRAYWANGYSLPSLQQDATQQRVTTIQTGVETTYIPWLWLKGTFFWNRLSDIESFDADGNRVLGKEIKQGVEVEGKTAPVFNTSLSAGYTFIDSKDDITGETLQNIPRHIVKLGIHYNDIQHTFRGTLLGRYARLNSSSDNNGRYNAVIWDLNLAKRVLHLWDTDLDLYFNVHNLFNGSQYSWEAWKNSPRWFEGGLKFEF